MATFSGPEDIYDELVTESDESWIKGLLSFSIIEEERIEWVKHFAEGNGRPPEPDEVKRWYEELAEGKLLRAKDTAETRLQAYFEEALEEYQSNLAAEIEEETIVQEIRTLQRFWPQFGVNVAGGFVGAVLMAALMVIIYWFVVINPSVSGIAKELNSEEVMEEGEYGEERRKE